MEAIKLGVTKGSTPKYGVIRGMSMLDFVFRLVAFLSTLASAIVTLTTNETLRFATQFVRFRAEFNDLPTNTLLVVVNLVVAGYLLLSLPISIFNIVRSRATNSRLLLIIFDLIMLVILTAGASAATAILYLAHNGNNLANWLAVCRQFHSYCERISGSLIGSFIGVAMLELLILMSAAALFRQR